MGIRHVTEQLLSGKNKTVIAVLFLCAASLVNAAAAPAAWAPEFPAASVGGPIVPGIGAASVGREYAVGSLTRPAAIMFHDALAEDPGQSAAADSPSAAVFVARLSLPARGIDWGELHPRNAVDVAGACGSPVYASAAGQAIAVREGYSGGYGNHVDIGHGNGIVTRYAHNERNAVTEGQMVAAGDVIGYMGSTGHSTGCHVHFEVLGTGEMNPFVRR